MTTVAPRPEIVRADNPTTEALDAVQEILDTYLVFPNDEARDAVVLWTAHTHVFYAFESTPRLSVYSRDPGSGKSRVLEVLEHLVPNPLYALNITPGVMWRSFEYSAPTVLMDEVDTVFGKKGSSTSHTTLRGILNAGHRKSGTIPRCSGAEDVKHFNVFGPVAMAGLGQVPDTIHSRSVRIGMRKRRDGETVRPFRLKYAQDPLARARKLLERWSADADDVLGMAEPDLPAADRDADVWEPLVAIADMAGADWPERARRACEKRNELCDAKGREAELSPGVRLLTDLRDLFAGERVMATEDILAGLWGIPESPWRGLRDGKALASVLTEYGVSPTTVRVNGTPIKGYKAEDLAEPWARYVAPRPEGEDD